MVSNRLPRRLRRLIFLALREGWQVELTQNLRLTLRKPGFPPIFSGSQASDGRSANQQPKLHDEVCND